MALPPIAATGYLPPGAHEADADEVEERFVEQLLPSNRRPPIFQWWCAHRSALDAVLTVEAQWLGGSFVSDKPEPDDIDVVNVIEGQSVDTLNPAQLHIAQTLLAGPTTKVGWHCDSYAIVTYPLGHPGHAQMVAATKYWEGWWAKTRPDENGNQIDRGYVVTS